MVTIHVPSMNNTVDDPSQNFYQDRYLEYANKNDYNTGVVFTTITPNHASTPLITSFSSTFAIQQPNSTIFLNYLVKYNEYANMNILTSASYSIGLISEI